MDSAMWLNSKVVARGYAPFSAAGTFTAFPRAICTYPANAAPRLRDATFGNPELLFARPRTRFLCRGTCCAEGVYAILLGIEFNSD